MTMPLPSEKLPATVRERYHHLVLADPEFDESGPIDMLLWSDLYPHMLHTKGILLTVEVCHPR
jgi:hypothetical protein